MVRWRQAARYQSGSCYRNVLGLSKFRPFHGAIWFPKISYSKCKPTERPSFSEVVVQGLAYARSEPKHNIPFVANC